MFLVLLKFPLNLYQDFWFSSPWQLIRKQIGNLSFFDGMGGMGCTHQKYPQPLVCPGALVNWLAIACQFVKAFVLLEVLAVAMSYSKRIKSLSISLCSKHRWHLTSLPFSIAYTVQVSIELNDIGPKICVQPVSILSRISLTQHATLQYHPSSEHPWHKQVWSRSRSSAPSFLLPGLGTYNLKWSRLWRFPCNKSKWDTSP